VNQPDIDSMWIVYDQRGIFDLDRATVLTVAGDRTEAIEDCKGQGGGCVYSPEGHLTYWLDGDQEWDATWEGTTTSRTVAR